MYVVLQIILVGNVLSFFFAHTTKVNIYHFHLRDKPL